jgi:hypothetical protein
MSGMPQRGCEQRLLDDDKQLNTSVPLLLLEASIIQAAHEHLSLIGLWENINEKRDRQGLGVHVE